MEVLENICSYHNNLIAKIVNRNGFELLLRLIHFCDENVIRETVIRKKTLAIDSIKLPVPCEYRE